MNDETPAPKIKSVEKSAGIIEAIAKRGRATTNELADACELPLGTVFDHLYTLESLGYVVKEDDRYRLGTTFLYLADQMRNSLPIYKQSKPHIDELARNTGEHASLMIEENGRGIYLYTAEGENNLTLIGSLGSQTPLHVSAPGKALLAFMPDERADAIVAEHGLDPATERTVTTESELHEQRARIRDRGYSLDHEEGIKGLYGIATPIIDRSNSSLLGAITLYTAADTNIDQFEQTMVDKLFKTKNKIEINLAYGDA
jgi:DNA-binding IclR family transcriptional regulator